MSPLPPPEPIRLFRPGIWIKPSWLRFYGLTLQTRMVVVDLDGDLLLYSPSPAAPPQELRDELEPLGTPRWLVAPNELHNVGLASFQEAWPGIHTTGCAGHPHRVPEIRFDLITDPEGKGEDPPWAADPRLRYHVIRGNAFLNEIVLLHEPTRTLVVTDAIEHFVRGDPTFVMPPLPLRWGFRACGITLDSPCMSPEHNLFCTDPDALASSLDLLADWPFDAVVMSHGRILEGPGTRDAFCATIRTRITRARRQGPLRRALFTRFAGLQ